MVVPGRRYSSWRAHLADHVLHRHQRAVEPAALLSVRGPALTLDGVGVHLLAGETLEGGDQVGAHALRHEVQRPRDLRVDRPRTAVHAHGAAGHVLHAAAHHHVGLARHDLRGRRVHGLEARGAEAVELLARDVLRIARHQRGDARDVGALLAHRRHATENHVVELARVERGPVAQRRERLRRELDGRDRVQRAVGPAAAARRAHRFEDVGVGHGSVPGLVALKCVQP